MDSFSRQPGLLVKMTGAPKSVTLSLAGSGGVRVSFQPLFTHIRTETGPGFAAGTSWFQMSAAAQGAEVNAWDLCHRLMTQGFGVAGMGAPAFAEPDLEQKWITGTEADLAFAAARTCEQPDPPDARLPFEKGDPFWFRDANHSQLTKARQQAGDPGGANRVRIAHFDTGYDPEHDALPKHLRLDLQKNFVESDRPGDATDRTGGFFPNLGHGMGTIGILAGDAIEGDLLGGAPHAEVIPIRVAESVVLFKNSAIAKAFDYVRGLAGDAKTRVHVVTMSMGGLASQAWAEAVNDLYEQGVFIVTAAGNNFGNLPTRNIVFPARFNRVVAACGVMADGRPYADLPASIMAGNYGPRKKMATAIAAYTPNAPWARLGCERIVDRDGAGTSSATPQIAAAAALWIQTHRVAYDQYSRGWMKVEAVRRALFDSAGGAGAQPDDRLGRGALRAKDALAKKPVSAGQLRQQPRDAARFPLLRVLSGLGLAPSNARQQMLELEALQLSQRSQELEGLLPDPDVDPATVSAENRRKILEALAETPGASQALRQALGALEKRARVVAPAPAQLPAAERERVDRALNPPIAEPQTRTLRVFAYDPLVGTRLDTAGINETSLEVRWEKLRPGPVGDYLEVVDIDPASGCCYAPVDLNHPSILARDGLSPSESDPRFHQQMVYAVAMKTIEHFERALGRVALWAPREIWAGGRYEHHFVRRLRIYPHAIREANAYYSPDKKALLFGYFPASESSPGDNLPGGTVFTCLSHDVIAHETTHALLDGLHRRFREPTNPDIFAFHEAFADIVALFQHFTVPGALRHQIARTRGDLARQNLLAELAQQFGEATGRYGALRTAVGKPPTPQDYQNAEEPHDRGAVLVAAVFDAFLNIYRRRSEDLVRLATGGTGVLPEGAIPVDLVNRLAQEASRTASQILNICIRALDYCPPVDLTFGDYIRALITADADLIPDDKMGYRVAFIEGFRRRGIYPAHVRNFSPESLRWQRPETALNLDQALDRMQLGWDLNVDRRSAAEASEKNAEILALWLKRSPKVKDEHTLALGFHRLAVPGFEVGGVKGELRGFEVHSVRPVRRVGPDNQQQVDLVIEITQSWVPPSGPRFRGGCTLVVDLETRQIRYTIRKRVAHADRIEQQRSFRLALAEEGLRGQYFDKPEKADEPFALLHR
jgi:hypothetical protein